MSEDQVELEMSLPLDSVGFLRWECPTCERELKGLVARYEAEPEPDSEEGYVAPRVAVGSVR